MPKSKLTKKLIDSADPHCLAYEIRDAETPGFLCKVSPSGRKTFMLQYRTLGGERRKPSIGQFGELTVDQARGIAKDWLALVRQGQDPSLDKQKAREDPTIKELCKEFLERHAIPHNKPRTVAGKRSVIKNHIVPALGKEKVADVKRAQISRLVSDLAHIPTTANHVLSCLNKMFNCAELWGYRADGTNPCRLVPKYRGGKRTRLIKNPELARLYDHLDRAEAEGLEHPTYILAIRLQFAFAARMSEIIELEWEWIDFAERRVVWPDSKTGAISKPLTEEAYALLSAAPRFQGSRYVVPAVTKPSRPMSKHSYWEAWKRILAACGIAHIGTHGIRHRAATDIANSGIPLKVGMTLTAHKTVTMFMRYVHVEDDQVRAAAEIVANRRAAIIQSKGQATSPLNDTPTAMLPAGGKVLPPHQAAPACSPSGGPRTMDNRFSPDHCGTAAILFLDSIEPLPLLDPTAAAQLLGLGRHTLACYRSRGAGPAYYKFGRWIRYAPGDLREWGSKSDQGDGLLLDPNHSPGTVRLVDTPTAARFLTVTRHCLSNYRETGTGPQTRRFGRRIYYPVDELRRWAALQRYSVRLRRSRE